MQRYRNLSLAAAIAAIALVIIGALVRSSGSGLGCPDWPRCYGAWIPPFRADALIEYSHRLAASIVGVLVLALAIVAWLRHRRSAGLVIPAVTSLLLVVVQAWIGRQVVVGELPPGLVVLHFSVAMILIALLTISVVNSREGRKGSVDAATVRILTVTGLTWVAMLLGAFMAQLGGIPSSEWPLLGGPIFTVGPNGLEWAHRLAAGALGPALAYVAFKDRRARGFVFAALATWAVQVVAGGANALTGKASWAVVVHVGAGAVMWAAVVGAATATFRRGAQVEPAPAASRSAFMDYVSLTKPRIIELLIITTVPSMVMAAKGWPSLRLIAATVLGGAMSAGAANAINCFVDRDIDGVMDRTANRPLPSGRLSPGAALRFGVALGTAGFIWLTLTVNLLAASLSTAALVYYVFVYTLWMKRRTSSNIVIGGAAGAAPVLVGWAAVRGTIDLPALALFAVVFYWTPPHFWALSLRYRNDYERAGVPMLPVVRGVSETARQILIYSIMLMSVSMLVYVGGGLGMIYLVSALVLGCTFSALAFRLFLQSDEARAAAVFRASLSYLTLLFVAVAVDVLIGAPRPDFGRVVFILAAPLFFTSQALVMFWATGFRDGARPPIPAEDLPSEVAWAALPTLGAAALFVVSWQALLR